MMETREMSIYTHAASNVVGTIADHNLESMKLSIVNTLMDLSSAHSLNQLNVLRCCFDNLLDLVCKMRRM